MKTSIVILSLLTLLIPTTMFATVLTSTPTEKEPSDLASVILNFFSDVDEQNWDRVAEAMTDSVYINYTELGGARGFFTPDEILTTWKSFLPGFERTIHNVHNIATWEVGDRATATMDAIALHFLNGDEWTVFVGYDTEFINNDGQWKLARIDLSLYSVHGNEELPAQALEPASFPEFNLTMSEDTQQTVEAFFEALESQNLEALVATFDENIVQTMPLAPNNFPKEIKGKNNLRNQYSGVMGFNQRYNRTYFTTVDPSIVLVKFEGTITTSEGQPYNNSYVNVFKAENGMITEIIEYFNPNILLRGWPGLRPENYSVHASGAPVSSGVTLQRVQFESNGLNLAGHLFLPPKFDETAQYPAIVVTGSWTSVKEQMPDNYASLLAEKGFIALTFDFTGFGESEGQPRQVEDYTLKIEDIKSALSFLTSHKNVIAAQITGLGVCASAGYMAHAAAQDERIKELVLVAPWLHNPEMARAIYDMRPGGSEALLAAAQAAKQKYAETGTMDYVLAASELDPLSAMYVPENVFDYYLNPAKAAGPYYDNRFAVSSWEPWINFDGIAAGKSVKQPTFIVHSESGAIPDGARLFYNSLTESKNIVWLNEFNQQQLYHETEAVHTAIDHVVEYLNRH
ncbi:MAG: nuclear transport factor 2 family protein [Balneolales bacterium]|nr:nuclear transport factor 2 family protein [Balneolales bacterium]